MVPYVHPSFKMTLTRQCNPISVIPSRVQPYLTNYNVLFNVGRMVEGRGLSEQLGRKFGCRTELAALMQQSKMPVQGITDGEIHLCVTQSI